MGGNWTPERLDAILKLRQPLGLVGVLNRVEKRDRLKRRIRLLRLVIGLVTVSSVMFFIFLVAAITLFFTGEQ